MNVVVLDSKYWPDVQDRGVEKKDIADVVRSVADEVLGLVDSLPEYVNLVVYPSVADDVIVETGIMGMTYSDEYASVYFDCTLPYGKERLLSGLREAVFHELVHAATFRHDPWQPDVLFGVVTEGLATVFERDYAGATPLWGSYEDDLVMTEWYLELKNLPKSETKNGEYFFKHSDGRKWIVYKTGSWMIDKLLESGEDLFDLIRMNHKDVITKFNLLEVNSVEVLHE